MKKIKKIVGGVENTMKGKPSNCHPDRVVCARGLCKSCYDKWLKKNNPGYAERQKKNQQNWMKKHKEKKKESDRQYRVHQDPLYSRIRTLRKYGITLDEYDFILKKQNGVCAICGRQPTEGKNLHVDHCHDTGVIRGLLCFRCNFGLSYFKEDKDVVGKAFSYLESGNELSKELEALVYKREKVEKEELIKKEEIIKIAKTRGISDSDKVRIIKLRGDGKTWGDLVKEFSQYSRSSIIRASKG